MTEELLREDFIQYLVSEGIEIFAKEFGTHGDSIFDLVYLDKNRKFVAVELKLTDWKKVIEQAERIKKRTPFVYIAMPLPATRKKRDAIITRCREKELGVYFFNIEGRWQFYLSPSERVTFHNTESEFIKYFEKQDFEQRIFYQYHFTFIAPLLGLAAEKCRDYEYKKNIPKW